jgi:allantoicase
MCSKQNHTIMALTTPEFTQLIDLAAARFGGRTLSCSDDFFAEKENLIQSGRGIFIPDKYTENGKWMDGWESRRKRTSGYDWCIVQLGASGKIHGVDIDTNHFLGNHPPFASIEACYEPQAASFKLQVFDAESSEEDPSVSEAIWTEILPKSPLNPGSQNFYAIENNETWTHLRLNIYPDGGVARLKVYGEVEKDWQAVKSDDLLDLAAATNGGKAVACNDEFFSKKDNINMPNRGANMGDGWETKRNRTPNNRDWLVLRLARKGRIQQILIDTCHFKGNYPDRCKLEGAVIARENEHNLDGIVWTPILNEMKLQADFEHIYTSEILTNEPFTHVRLTIFPDGGISRLRIFGFAETDVLTVEELNKLDSREDGTGSSVCATFLTKCCGANNWVQKMVAARPFSSRKAVFEAAENAWFSCKKSDWLEAFTHHPKIGDVDSLKKKFASTATWASGEQGKVAAASTDVLEELKRYNDLYINKFGFIFIVFATGKTADEMLTILKDRYKNDTVEEIVNAMLEQNKITKIRLEKLLL